MRIKLDRSRIPCLAEEAAVGVCLIANKDKPEATRDRGKEERAIYLAGDRLVAPMSPI